MKKALRIYAGASIALFSLCVNHGAANTIYSVDFTNETDNTPINAPINAYGWRSFRDNGIDYSASLADPFRIIFNEDRNLSYAFSSSGTIVDTNFAIIYPIGSLDPENYQNDLVIRFEEEATDAREDGDIFWRGIVQIGAGIYVSDPLPASATRTVWQLNLDDPIWHSWTGESDLSDGFDMNGISAEATNLPGGNLSNIGVLIDDGDDSNDRQRLFNFSISGTPTTPGVLHGQASDTHVREDGTVAAADSTQLFQGGAGAPAFDNSAVMVFQLPDFGAEPTPFQNAQLEFRLETVLNQALPTDLYGLGSRSSPDVQASDYYGQSSTADPSDASRLEENILTGSSTPSRTMTSLSGSVALTNYLNAQYADGSGAGRYVFLRLSTNVPIDAVHRYVITSADGALADHMASAPLIRYNFGPPTMTRPFIWVRAHEQPAILDKIATQAWAGTLRDGIVARAASDLANHQADRDAFIRELPVNWSATPAQFQTIPAYSESSVRHPTEDKFNAALDCAVLYYLTEDTSYAECAADILHNAIQTLLPVAPSTNASNGGWIFQDDLLKGARVVGNQLPVVYDFLYDYLEEHQVYDVPSAAYVDFDFSDAQTFFRTWYELTRTHGQWGSNWSALMSNSMLQNLLALDDQAERDAALEIYLSTGNYPRQRSLADDHQLFVNSGNIWPEPLSYALTVNQIRSNHMMMLERIYPELDLMTLYGEFPTNLERVSQFTYPNNRRILFGDMPRGSGTQPYFEYEMIYQQAQRRGSLGLAADLGGRINSAIQDGSYNRSNLRGYANLGMHNELLQLLWQSPTIEGAPIVEELPRTDHIPFAGIRLQRNPSSFDNPNYGLMTFVGGAGYIHSHASGMSMELYGAGRVMGAKSGKSVYQTDLHEDYYRVFASNNTVITNGASRGEGGWENIGINTVENVAVEPQAFEEGVSDHCSFTITSFADDRGTLAEADQERTLAIIRTSPTSGFYVDLFRSKSTVTNRTATTLDGPVVDQFHDYIYRNIGDTDINITLNGQALTLSPQPDRFANDIGDEYKQPGWRYFENVQVSHPVTGSMRTRFTADIDGGVRHMEMHMPDSTTREYAYVESPPIIDAPSVYGSQNAPTIVVRQIGEAWDQAFAVVYEPWFQSDGATVQSVETLEQHGVVRGVRVTSSVDGQNQIHHIITQPGPNETFEDPAIGLSFTGRFGVATLLPDNTVRLYVGEGSQMSYRGNSSTSLGSITQFEAVFEPDTEPSVVANSPVTVSAPQAPIVRSFSREANGIFTIESLLTPGTPYRVQSSSTLAEDSWTDEISGIAPDGTLNIQVQSKDADVKFFRIVSP